MTEQQFKQLAAEAHRAGLQIESGDILLSEDQGTPASTALTCVDRWLSYHDGAVRMQVRILARETVEREWDCICEGPFSEPITAEQAEQMVGHWRDLQRDAARRYYAQQEQSRLQVEAFGASRPRG